MKRILKFDFLNKNLCDPSVAASPELKMSLV